MGMIKVSVLTYVKNDASHIEQCMRSVMAQDLKELEYIVIDGGSTDGTREIIDRLKAEDNRIRVVESDPGLGHQFNVGVKEARGEYIGVCESDDYLLPGMYSFQYEIACREQLDVLRADAFDFFMSGGDEKRIPFSLPGVSGLKNRLLAGEEARDAMRIGVNRFFSGLYRRSFLIDNELFMNETPGAAYQDNTFAFLTLIKANRIYISDKAFYCYRLDNPNASCNSPERLNMVDVEYHLLQERLIRMGEWDKYKETYLTWLILNHLWFCNLLDNELKIREIDIFYNALTELLKMEDFSTEFLRKQDLDFLEAVDTSKQYFVNMVMDVCKRIEKARFEIKKLGSNDIIIIFGAGNIGKLVIYALKNRGINAQCITDNNEKIWGDQIEGIPVLAPEKACEYGNAARYIVANVDHNTEIREQLAGYSISEDRMIVCDSYDFVARKILMDSVGDYSSR